jgi:prepilin-type processing-associated H-X9-DG protein
MTLLELLVTITVISVLASLALAAGRGVMVKARQAKCASNLRQIGMATLSFTQEHHGDFPMTSHGLDASNYDQAWVFTLAPYLADVDEVRVCPVDPKAAQRLEEGGSSYVLNSYLTVPEADAFGQSLGGFTNLSQVPSPANTPLAFVINFRKGTGYGNDHTHSQGWTDWNRVVSDIQPDAFRMGPASPEADTGSSNYLFVDGHVENLPARQVRDWIRQGHNFANPTSSTTP